MGFTINKEIKTILTYKDIALIAVAMGRYCDELGDNGKVWTRELEDWYRSFSAVV